MQLDNLAAIITGGASGMGAATAKLLKQFGVRVSLLDTNKTAVEKLAKEIDGLGLSCDVTQVDSVANAIANAEQYHGPARICINCAGIVHSRRMVNQQGVLPLAEFQQVVNINLTGTFNVMSLATAQMIPLPPVNATGERGVIINTASIAAFEGQMGQTAYSASKGGIISMTLPAARELAQFGIRVMAIAPGLVDTPMFNQITPEAREQLTANVPFPKRLAQPEEFASLVIHIIENAMLNGEVIRLDGGLRMQAK